MMRLMLAQSILFPPPTASSAGAVGDSMMKGVPTIEKDAP
jgi:hypothetical protein